MGREDIQDLNMLYYNNFKLKQFTMKSKLQFLTLTLLLSLYTYAQETTVNLSMETAYVNQVYYKLSTETQTDFKANSWDIAFLRISSFEQGMVVNDAIGISVFEAGSNTEWDAIDIANEADWTQLYNSDTERVNGAFMKGSATYGWGEYNVATHLVTGTVVFVLKYTDGSFKKFICEQYGAGYSIKYASWNGTSWGEDVTAEILNANNENNNYNYYSLQNNEEVVAEPAATDWDIVFRQYVTNVGGGLMYPVTGVLQGDNVEVAQVVAESDTTDLTYTIDINTIGYDWKSLNYNTEAFDVDSAIHYYVKDVDGNIFKLYFTKFGGTETGDVEFVFEDITSTLNTEDIAEDISFGIYPNPVNTDKKINVIFDVNAVKQDNNTIEIYSLSGRQVYKTTLSNATGFYNKQIDVSNFNAGVYMLKFTAGNATKTKKIIIQ